MIETLILGTLAIAAAAVIGYFYGKNKSEYLHMKKNGWEITACENLHGDKIFFLAIKGEKKFLVEFDPTKDGVDWFIKDVVNE